MKKKSDPRARNQRFLLKTAQEAGLRGIEDFLDFPKHIQIETSAVCNARCVMCPIAERMRDVPRMKPELFKKILKELKAEARRVTKVSLHLDGEPLLDCDLEKRIRALKKAGIRMVEFTTNASLLTPKRARSILRSGLDQISFSIDGVRPQTFEKIRRGLDYETCVKNIEQFLRYRKQMRLKKPAVRIRMTIQPSNEKEYGDFLAFWAKRLSPQDDAYGRLLHNSGNWLKSYRLPRAISDRALLNSSACISPWTSLVVLSDGRVPLCCSDFNAMGRMGDATVSTLREIWHGPVFSRVRQAHLEKGRDGLPALCHDCISWHPAVKLPGFKKKQDKV